MEQCITKNLCVDDFLSLLLTIYLSTIQVNKRNQVKLLLIYVAQFIKFYSVSKIREAIVGRKLLFILLKNFSITKLMLNMKELKRFFRFEIYFII